MEKQIEKAQMEKLQAVQQAIKQIKGCQTEQCKFQKQADANCHVQLKKA
jgi:hypothetical protein